MDVVSPALLYLEMARVGHAARQAPQSVHSACFMRGFAAAPRTATEVPEAATASICPPVRMEIRRVADRLRDGVVRHADPAARAGVRCLAAVGQDLAADGRGGLEKRDIVSLTGELDGRRAARHARPHHQEAFHPTGKVVRRAAPV